MEPSTISAISDVDGGENGTYTQVELSFPNSHGNFRIEFSLFTMAMDLMGHCSIANQVKACVSYYNLQSAGTITL